MSSAVRSSSDFLSSLSGMTAWTVPATKPAAVATAWVTLSITEPAVLLTASPAAEALSFMAEALSFMLSSISRARAGAFFTARRDAEAIERADFIMPPARLDPEALRAPPERDDAADFFVPADARALLPPPDLPRDEAADFFVPPDRPPLAAPVSDRAVVADRFAADFPPALDFFFPAEPFFPDIVFVPRPAADEDDFFPPEPDLPDPRFAACLAIRPPFGKRIVPTCQSDAKGRV